MTTNSREQDLSGTVCYIDFLHLDTAVKDTDPENKHCYKLEFKTRPMVLVRKIGYNANGIASYLVCKLTSHKPKHKNSLRYVPIGKVIDVDTESVIDLCNIMEYPGNLIKGCKKKLDQETLRTVLTSACIGFLSGLITPK